jgi:hypothetical protein
MNCLKYASKNEFRWGPNLELNSYTTIECLKYAHETGQKLNK